MGVAHLRCLIALVLVGLSLGAPQFSKKSDGKSKRPFCNAFTGCGRKRSDPSMNDVISAAEFGDNDSFADDWAQLASNYQVIHIDS